MSSLDLGESPFPGSPVIPAMHDGDRVIAFRCYKGISCFNACCQSIDITLTPYDILRLSRHLGLSTTDFLRDHTVPFEMEKDGIAGVKFRPRENSSACQFVTDEGCQIYENRPTACRYYPVALLALRRQDEYQDRQAYALVKEPHCRGHEEPRELTIDAYRAEQDVVFYDDLNREWNQMILKKKSLGPTVGAPSLKSRQLFFMVSYDLDTFRRFVLSDNFQGNYVLEETLIQTLATDDIALMRFGFRLLRQVLFGEQTLPEQPGAWEKRTLQRQPLWEAQREAEIARLRESRESQGSR
ncbi:MAG: YkgJ family cysteine cluster protein [Pseudomonadota bacterium]